MTLNTALYSGKFTWKISYIDRKGEYIEEDNLNVTKMSYKRNLVIFYPHLVHYIIQGKKRHSHNNKSFDTLCFNWYFVLSVVVLIVIDLENRGLLLIKKLNQ